MFVVTVEFEIHVRHVASFRETIGRQALNSLELEAGCRQFDVCFDAERSNRCFLYEKYDDPAAFDEHLASQHFKDFNATVAPWVIQKTVSTWQQERP